MPETHHHPNGNGRSMWAAMSICSAVVLTICGAFGSSYVRDQTRVEARQTRDEAAGIELARTIGEMEERLDHIEALAHTNRDNIVATTRDLDTMLQREINLVNANTRGDLVNLDGRLQEEISRNAEERRAQLTEMRDRLTELEKWTKAFALLAWTKDDQRQFQGQLGVTLRPADRQTP